MPVHSAVVHFPVVISYVLPVLVLVFAYMIKKNKMSGAAWPIIIGLHAIVTLTGYLALESGETNEKAFAEIVTPELILKHETTAEIFVGLSVLCLLLSIASQLVRKDIQFPLRLAIACVGILGCFKGYEATQLGNQIVSQHASSNEKPAGLLPTPSQSTSESAFPVEENDSLKADEHDYGESEEYDDEDAEDLKQED